jgi:hypothetical protein
MIICFDISLYPKDAFTLMHEKYHCNTIKIDVITNKYWIKHSIKQAGQHFLFWLLRFIFLYILE